MALFQTIHTNYGLSQLALAESSGIPINLTHMAVGDGAGSDITPIPAMATLVNERFRSTVNNVVQDPLNPTSFYVEMIIPFDQGGWTIREFGIFDEHGSLFAIGNFPATYKTVPSDGASNDLVIRAEVRVANADLITIVIDPTVAVASRAWVLSTINKCYMIPGGTTGQIVTKLSNTCGDYDWRDPDTANVIVDTIEEEQTVGAAQVTFNLTLTTTLGLAVYVKDNLGGERLPKRAGAGGWQQGASNTQVVLGTSYSTGAKVTFVQNEPAGSLPDPLVKSQNLADVPDKAVGRTNMSVYSKAEVDAAVTAAAPPGEVAYFARNTAPTGWLKANGAVVSRTTYSALFTAIGTLWGAGDGASTFALPDLRGEFLRAWDDGRGVDSGRSFASVQLSQNLSHGHAASSASAGSHAHTGTTEADGSHSHTASTGGGGAHSHTGTTATEPNHTHSATIGTTGSSHTHQINGKMADMDASGNNFRRVESLVPLTVGASDNIGTASTTGSTHTHNATIAAAGSHDHTLSTNTSATHTHSVAVAATADHTHAFSTAASGAHSHTITVDASGGNEARPRSVALLVCIKY